MNDQSNLPATMRSISEIVDEYEEKRDAIPARLSEFKDAVTAAEMASTIGGTYAGPIWGRYSTPSLDERTMRRNLLCSAWKHVYHGLNVPKIAPASDRARYERDLENPPEFTKDNIRASFGKYLIDPREHILRGLAETFSDLDPAFRSHSKVKIGVKALPKRIILSGFGEYSYASWGQEKMRDVLNAMASFEGREHVHSGHISEMTKIARKHGEADWWGGTLRVFKNGNAHLFFDRWALDIVNGALAEYYGDVLPDTPDETAERRPGANVPADLQFYRTPPEAADHLIYRAAPRAGMKILEPSCGDGALIDAIRRYAEAEQIEGLRVSAYEVHAGRADEARAKGYGVVCRNFLDVPPSRDFDMVVMNPPFYGKHYQRHIEHALRFLKPGGVLYAILPISAVEDHGYIERPRFGRDTWEDLPVGSFAASGTRINTGIARFFSPKETSQ